jgi:hypothetical protein
LHIGQRDIGDGGVQRLHENAGHHAKGNGGAVQLGELNRLPSWFPGPAARIQRDVLSTSGRSQGQHGGVQMTRSNGEMAAARREGLICTFLGNKPLMMEMAPLAPILGFG